MIKIIDQREGVVYPPPENWGWFQEETGWVWIVDLNTNTKWAKGMLDENGDIRLI